MNERLIHEWHAVGNIPTCKHCRRAEHMIRPRRGDECPARLRTALDGERAAVVADLLADARAREERNRDPILSDRAASALLVAALRIRDGAHLPPTPETTK